MNSHTSGWLVLTRNFVAGSHPQNDSYPRMLSELASVEIDHRKVWPISGSNTERYDYQVFSNGFSISVTKSASLFSQYETVSNYFELEMENSASKKNEKHGINTN